MSVQIDRFQAVSWTAVMVAGRGERHLVYPALSNPIEVWRHTTCGTQRSRAFAVC
jgi:hypothetical protein